MPYIEKTLSSYAGGEITPLMFNALMYKAVELSDKDPEERAAFIRYCDGIIKALPAADAESREEVLYALKNMRCTQTLEYVLELDSAVFSGLPINKTIFCCGAVYDMKEFVYELYDTAVDMDGDGKITAADARLALRTAVNLESAELLGLPRETSVSEK